MKKTIAAIALVATLSLGTVPAAGAATWWGHHRTTQTESQTPTMTAGQKTLLQGILDRVALTDIELSPFGRYIVNATLKAVLPPLCPILGQAAAPGFQDLVTNGCLGVAAAPDPYAALLDFLPLACQLGDVIFPDYAALLDVACQLLY